MVRRGRSRRRFRLVLVLLLVVLVLGVAVGVMLAMQRRLIYFPDTSPVPPAGRVIDGARDVTLHTSDGPRARRLVRSRRRDVQLDLAVLVAPGNGGNRAGRAGLARELSRRGLAVLLMDYRGYGGNPGSPSEQGLIADAVAGVRRR